MTGRVATVDDGTEVGYRSPTGVATPNLFMDRTQPEPQGELLMQRHRLFMFLMTMGFVLVLSGCGRSTLMPMEAMPIDLTVEAAQAKLQAVSDVSNSILVSDLVFTPAGETERIHGATSCRQTRCLSSVLGRPFLQYGLAIDDFESLSRDPEVKGGGFVQYRGVSLGGFNETLYQREEDIARDLLVKIDTDIQSIEGWMQYSRFAIQINDITNGFIQAGQYSRNLTGQRYAVGSSIGQLSGTNPVEGNATWKGVMVGGRIGDTPEIGDPLRGDAALTFDFANAKLDVAFINIRTLSIAREPVTYDDMTWENLAVRDGRFGGGFDEPTIEGRFYGPNHEEIGGIFQRNRIVGAFGAQR